MSDPHAHEGRFSPIGTSLGEPHIGESIARICVSCGVFTRAARIYLEARQARLERRRYIARPRAKNSGAARG